MCLQERLVKDLHTAMREQDGVRRSTLRLLRAAIQNEEIAQRKPLDDAAALAVVSKQARQRQESIEAYRNGNRPDLAKREEAELAILQEYLPEPLSHKMLVQLAANMIKEVGATGPKEMGKVMRILMPQVQGRADGTEVNKIVMQLLQE